MLEVFEFAYSSDMPLTEKMARSHREYDRCPDFIKEIAEIKTKDTSSVYKRKNGFKDLHPAHVVVDHKMPEGLMQDIIEPNVTQ